MAWGLEKLKFALAKRNAVAVFRIHMWEVRLRTLPDIDDGSGTLGEFEMPGDEIGMQMGENDVPNLQPMGLSVVEVNIHVALGVDYGCHAVAGNDIGSVGQTSQVKALKDHGVSMPQKGRWTQLRRAALCD